MKLQHLTRLVEIYGKWESQTNANKSTSKIGRIYTETDFVDELSNDLEQRDRERLGDKVVTLTSLSNGELELLCLGKLLPCLVTLRLVLLRPVFLSSCTRQIIVKHFARR
jgi:hypothetical protein